MTRIATIAAIAGVGGGAFAAGCAARLPILAVLGLGLIIVALTWGDR